MKKLKQIPGLILIAIGYVITAIGTLVFAAGAWLTGDANRWING